MKTKDTKEAVADDLKTGRETECEHKIKFGKTAREHIHEQSKKQKGRDKSIPKTFFFGS